MEFLFLIYGKSLLYKCPFLFTKNAFNIELEENPAATPVSTTISGL